MLLRVYSNRFRRNQTGMVVVRVFLSCWKPLSKSNLMHIVPRSEDDIYIYIYIYVCVCVCVCVEMVDFSESDKMIKISGKVDKSNTYDEFSSNVSFFIQGRTSSDKNFFNISAIDEIDPILVIMWKRIKGGKGCKNQRQKRKKMEGI